MRGLAVGHRKDRWLRRDSPDVDGEPAAVGGIPPPRLDQVPHADQVICHMISPMLSYRGQGCRRPDALRPVRAADECVLRGLHHGRLADDCRHGIAVAHGLGKNGHVGFQPVEQMRTARVHSKSCRHLIDNQDGTGLIRDPAHAFQISRNRFISPDRLDDNGGQFITTCATIGFKLLQMVNRKGRADPSRPLEPRSGKTGRDVVQSALSASLAARYRRATRDNAEGSMRPGP
jgi:hypothetical protein